MIRKQNYDTKFSTMKLFQKSKLSTQKINKKYYHKTYKEFHDDWRRFVLVQMQTVPSVDPPRSYILRESATPPRPGVTRRPWEGARLYLGGAWGCDLFSATHASSRREHARVSASNGPRPIKAFNLRYAVQSVLCSVFPWFVAKPHLSRMSVIARRWCEFYNV